MTIASDFSITTGTNNIRYIGAAHAANGAGYSQLSPSTDGYKIWLMMLLLLALGLGADKATQPDTPLRSKPGA